MQILSHEKWLGDSYALYLHDIAANQTQKIIIRKKGVAS